MVWFSYWWCDILTRHIYQQCVTLYSEKFSHGANVHAFRARADFAKIRTAKF